MSWYRRRPHIKTPPRAIPRHTSPVTEKILEQSKELGPKAVVEKSKKSN